MADSPHISAAQAWQLVAGNAAYISRLVRRRFRIRPFWLEPQDVEGGARVAMFRRLMRWDPARRPDLSGYASQCAWWAVGHAISATRGEPERKRGSARMVLEEAWSELCRELGRSPSTDELAARVSTGRARKWPVTHDDVADWLVGEDPSRPLSLDFFAIEGAESRSVPAFDLTPEEAAIARQEQALMAEAVEALPLRERHAVLRHVTEETLQQVGDRLSLSRERIRQLEITGHNRMRRHLRAA